jgi:hypothetical protein
VVATFLSVSGALALAAGIASLVVSDGLSRLARHTLVDLHSVVAADNWHHRIVIAQAAAFLVTAIAWFVWVHRAARINGLVAVRPPRFSPAGMVGWWFLPVGNLFLPFLAVNDLYRSADPSSTINETRRIAKLPLVWWISFVGAGFLVRAAGASNGTLSRLQQRGRLEFVAQLATLLAAVTAIRIVALITKGLRAVNESSDVGSPPAQTVVDRD